jgi:two-component sensor histidine kinase
MLNELTAAIGILGVAERRCSDAESLAALSRAADQLDAVAETHRLLTPPDLMCRSHIPCDLQRLCEALSRARLRPAGIKLVLVDNPLPLQPRQAWLLNLVVSELITNAARHAFDDEAGRVEVRVSSSGAFAICEVTDDGGGMAGATRGTGSRLIDALMAELNGACLFESGPFGTSAFVKFPLEWFDASNASV